MIKIKLTKNYFYVIFYFVLKYSDEIFYKKNELKI